MKLKIFIHRRYDPVLTRAKNPPKDSWNNHIQQCSSIQINTQNSVAFLYTKNAVREKDIRKTIPFTIASKKPNT